MVVGGLASLSAICSRKANELGEGDTGTAQKLIDPSPSHHITMQPGPRGLPDLRDTDSLGRLAFPPPLLTTSQTRSN